MSAEKSLILIYGICETPNILWDASKVSTDTRAVNRQYIRLSQAPTDIRIGDRGWLDLMPDQLLQFETNEDIFIFAKEALLSKAHPFSKPLRNALISYLTFVEHRSIELQKIKKNTLSDALFCSPEQICFSAFLPLPHPKIPLTDEAGKFIGAASFDLGFHIGGKTHLISFSDGQFLRKSERELRQKLLKESDRFILTELSKPNDTINMDENFLSGLLSIIPKIADFRDEHDLPHGLYYPAGLNKLYEILE